LGILALGSWTAMAIGTHAPITILGNGDFTEANGVLSGSGTEDDPYVISGWEIEVSGDELHGVKIENTSAYVVLRGLVVRGANTQKGSGIRVGFASNVTIDSCAVSSSFNGIEIASSTDVTMRSTVLYVVGHGLSVTGETPDEYRHTIDASNQLNNRAIRYVYGVDGAFISGEELAHLTVAASRDVRVSDVNASNGDGIHLAFVEDSQIEDNIAYRNSWDGIRLYRCQGNVLRNNEMGNNRRAAMSLLLSTDNEIVENRFLANDYGLILTASDRNRVDGNIAAANPSGIEISGGSTGNLVTRNILYHENTTFGVAIDQASGNEVRENVFAGCETGVLLNPQSSNNRILGNTLVGGAYAFQIVGSHNVVEDNLISQMVDGILFQATFGEPVIRGNTFRGNVFSYSTHRHLTTNTDSTGNTFAGNAFLQIATQGGWVYDAGDNLWTEAGLGNYWADYVGEDENGDGIGDVPVQVLPSGAEDRAPLTSPTRALSRLGVLATCEIVKIELVLSDGARMEQPVLVADEAHERFTGYRGIPQELMGGVPGILFAYDESVEGGPTGSAFTMQTVSVDLDILFFAADGSLVGRESMEAASETRYTVEGTFRYALELPGGSIERLGIDEQTRLVVPAGT
jgi:parallel beta-helix repeat protein